MSDQNLLICYNRGCGKKFDPRDNKEDACQHHPGHPVFHDAYKGWSCCNKKCTDFTEFLNIKGCTKSKHTDIKPIELPKPTPDKSKTNEVIEPVSKSLNNIPPVQRPSFDYPQVTLKPNISKVLLDQAKEFNNVREDNNVVIIGQTCRNNCCKAEYKGPESDLDACIHHPGSPIFHEGMKYWSCCKKKTTDFTEFLEQPGCSQGTHLWKEKGTGKKVKCRMDWHQTASSVVVSVYAKKYDPDLSIIKLNPIRLTVNLSFPEDNSKYNLDIELRGVVDVEGSSVNMLPSKVEIILKKKEPGSWVKLDIPREIKTDEMEKPCIEENITAQVDAVDLSDI